MAQPLPRLRPDESLDREQNAMEMRGWMLDRLDHGKRSLAAYQRQWVEAGKLDQLAESDRLRQGLELLDTRIRSLLGQYHGFHRQGQQDQAMVLRLYDYDADLLDAVQNLAVDLENLTATEVSATQPSPVPAPDSILANRMVQLDNIIQRTQQVTQALDAREAFLKGYAP